MSKADAGGPDSDPLREDGDLRVELGDDDGGAEPAMIRLRPQVK